MLTDHKLLIFFKTQPNLSRRQVEWLDKVQSYNMTIEYKPGKEMVTVDALSRLYTRMAQGINQLNPDWSMLVMKDLNKGFQPNTLMQTQEMVIKNKHLFRNHYGTLHRKLP